MREEKRSEVIHDALNFLDDKMIEDVEKLRGFVEKEEFEHGSNAENRVISMENKSDIQSKKRIWRKWGTMAASICVFFLAGWMVSNGLFSPADTHEKDKMENTDEAIGDAENIVDENNRGESSMDGHEGTDGVDDMSGVIEETALAAPESLKAGVVIPQMEVNLKKADDGIEVDMIGFFILNGRSYIQYEFQQDYVQTGADFVGKKVGHITGMIDEWTKEDGYVDGAGTYTGDVYEVKGVSPEFMLCMVGEDGSVETFINHNDITLYKGSNLVDDWLDLRGNVDAISVEIIEDIQFAYQELALTEEEMGVFVAFLDAFAEGEFVYVKEKIEHPFGGDWDTPDMMEFYFVKENGVRLRFRTLGDGYVSFPWINACIKMDQELYDEVVNILTEHAR